MIILGYDHEEMFSAPGHLASIHPISISSYPALMFAGCLFHSSWGKGGVTPRTSHQFIARPPQRDKQESPVSPVCRSLDGGDEAGAAGENPLWRSENRQIGTKPRVSSGHQSSKVRLKNHLPTVQSYENPGLGVKRPNAGRTVFILIFHLGKLLSCFVYSAPQRVTVYALCKYWSIVEPFKSLDEDKEKTVGRQIQQIERWREHLAGGALTNLGESQRNDSHPQEKLKVDFYDFLPSATETWNPVLQPNWWGWVQWVTTTS